MQTQWKSCHLCSWPLQVRCLPSTSSGVPSTTISSFDKMRPAGSTCTSPCQPDRTRTSNSEPWPKPLPSGSPPPHAVPLHQDRTIYRDSARATSAREPWWPPRSQDMDLSEDWCTRSTTSTMHRGSPLFTTCALTSIAHGTSTLVDRVATAALSSGVLQE